MSVAQLKKWLAYLGLPTKGGKAELLARLNAVPIEERDSVLMMDQAETEDETEVHDAMLGAQRKEISKNQEILRNLQAEIRAATDMITQLQLRNSVNANRGEQQEEAALVNNLDARQDDAGMSNGDEIQIGARSDDNAAGSSSMFLLANEVLLEFTGQTSVRNWIMQLQNVASAFNLNKMQCRLLCMAKLKGVALQWLHADPARIIQPFEELLQQLKLAFDGKVTKGELRRNFERRNWKFGESFVTYYDSKVE